MKQCLICKIMGAIAGLGAIAYALYGLMGKNVVMKVAAGHPRIAMALYALFGLAGVMKLLSCCMKCPACCKVEKG